MVAGGAGLFPDRRKTVEVDMNDYIKICIALKSLYEDDREYIEINHLGNAINNYSMKMAREALLLLGHKYDGDI